MSKKILTFDFGATSGRAILGEYDGKKLVATELHRFDNHPTEVNGHLYWDILGLFHEIKQGLIKTAIAGHKDLDAVGIDTWGVDFALLDKNGMLISNPFNYRDSLTDGELERVDKIYPLKEIYRRTGTQLIKFNTLFQLTAIRALYPELLDRAKKLMFIPDLMNWYLTGVESAEFSIASTSSMLDIRTHDWDQELLRALGVDASILPPVTPPCRVLGKIRPELRDETGIDCQVVSICGHDTGSAYLAVPMEKGENCACLSCGTWSLFGAELEEPLVTEEGFKANFSNEGGIDYTTRYLKNIIGLWISGEIKREYERKEGAVGYATLTKEIFDAPAFRSFINPDDERFLTPGHMCDKVKEFCRETGQPVPETRGEILRTAEESLALKYRMSVDELEGILGKHIDTLRVVGGGCQNQALMKFTAGALARPVYAGPVEATAIGNMTCQLLALGEFSDRWEARKAISASFETVEHLPATEEMTQWEEAYARFRKIVAAC